MQRTFKTAAVMVIASTGIIAEAYIPKPRTRAHKDFITRVYARSTGVQRWEASEARKREILSNLDQVKKHISNKAETFYIDRNTKITGITAREKVIVHSTKLMAQIANALI